MASREHIQMQEISPQMERQQKGGKEKGEDRVDNLKRRKEETVINMVKLRHQNSIIFLLPNTS